MPRICKQIIIFIIAVVFSSVAFAAEKRNQLEELLIWKMSDELKLTAQEEKKFTEVIRHINDKKSVLNNSLKDSLTKLKQADSKTQEKELKIYRQVLNDYNHLSLEEFDSLKPLLGAERMIKYLDIKQDLANRIKSMLLTPESTPAKNKKLPSPKIIEEK